MLRADLGDFLYIIVGIVLLFAGGIEKYIKAKRQQQQNQPMPSSEQERRYDDFEEEEQAPPQTLEDLVKRMMQANESQPKQEIDEYEEEAQSLETIPAEPERKNYYQPVKNNFVTSAEEKAIYAVKSVEEEKAETSFGGEFDFDLRNAVIAAEILHRKY